MRWGDVTREQQRMKQLFWSIKRQTKTRTGADPKDARAVFAVAALINTLWLNNTQFLGLRGCQEQRDMRWGDVTREQQRMKQLFWSIKRQTKTRTGADPKDARAVFAVEGSERDPVRTYDLYAS